MYRCIKLFLAFCLCRAVYGFPKQDTDDSSHPLSSISILSNNEQGVKTKSIKCTFYNEHCSKNSTEPQCVKTEEQCYKIPGMKNACYSVWTNDTEKGFKLHLKGCWHAQQDKCGVDSCVAYQRNAGKMFCCCHTDLCNAKFYSNIKPNPYDDPILGEENKEQNKKENVRRGDEGPWLLAVYIFVPILCLVFVVVVVYWVYRRVQMHKYMKAYPAQQMQLRYCNGSVTSVNKQPPSPSIHSTDQIVKMGLLKRGRFGEVFQGVMNGTNVAIKVFPPQDSQSWVQEQQIYKTPGMHNHPNILLYYDSTIRGVGTDAEFWLVTSYCEFGALYDYLKAYTLEVPETLQIVIGMLNGLSFLHAERINGECKKPSIVHRDIKSKNILLKADRTPCLADFGLAIRCEHGRTPDNVQQKVGTHRYMSPEVLEGATEFSAFAFKQIDVYAMACVIWEILTRVNLNDCPAVCDYKLPYEVEGGMRPTPLEMRNIVATQRKRPLVREQWKHDQVAGIISHTMEEMWDQEPEARITAGCALERLLQLEASLIPSSVPLPPEDPPASQECTPLITNGHIATDAHAHLSTPPQI